MQRFARIGFIVLPVLLLSALGIHFLMTLAYLTPLNPMKLRYDTANQAYMQPFFSQNWQLFAPNPANDTRILMVACRVQNETGETTTMTWSDISTPLRAMYNENRFSPADRLDRLQVGTMRSVFRHDPLLDKLKESEAAENSELGEMVKRLEEQRERDRERSITILNRIGAAHCDRMYGEGNTSEVRVRMAINTFPRFSQRHLPDEAGKLEYYTFDWAPYERVASMIGSR
jgi:hypothetical protein